MGLILLTLIGAVIGWLATIIFRIEDSREIVLSAVVGVAGAVMTGMVVGGGTLLGSVTGWSLVCATLGAAITTTVFNLIRRRSFG